MVRITAMAQLLIVAVLLAVSVAAEAQTGATGPTAVPASDGSPERAAMRRLDFLIGEWEGGGWIQIGPDQRWEFSVVESYRYRGDGLVIDGEGTFRLPGTGGDSVSPTRYGLGIIFFDRQSSEYRMWHYGGSAVGHTFTVTLDVDPEARTLRYTTVGGEGQPYRFGLRVGGDGVWTAVTERPGPDGTWRTTMEFRMQRAADPPAPTAAVRGRGVDGSARGVPVSGESR